MGVFFHTTKKAQGMLSLKAFEKIINRILLFANIIFGRELFMALKISKNAGLTDIVSDVNPITTTHPTSGSAQAVQLWLFNDDATKTYQSVNIDPTDAVSTDESTWVQLAPDNAGVAGTYGAASAPLTMADITTANVAKPFWCKVTTPSVGDSQNKTDIKLTVNGREFAV